jgi:hypothetical protein
MGSGFDATATPTAKSRTAMLTLFWMKSFGDMAEIENGSGCWKLISLVGMKQTNKSHRKVSSHIAGP